MKINLLIVDDDSLIRESLKIILDIEESINVVECAENGLDAYNICANNKIDIALIDIRMPVMNGVDATKLITSSTDTKVLILTTFDEDEYINEAIRNGASGYLLKNNTPDKIKEAIFSIVKGNSVIQENVLNKLRAKLEPRKTIIKHSFTERELEVIAEIANGLSNKEIAKKLFISEGTVKNYISNVLTKTKLKHRTQIAVLYLKGEL